MMGRVFISDKLNTNHVQNLVLKFQSRSKPKVFHVEGPKYNRNL